MSLLQNTLDSLAAVFRNPWKWIGKKVGVYKAHSDYYGSQKDTCKYWQNPVVTYWVGSENYARLKDAVLEWASTLRPFVRLEELRHEYGDGADLVIEIGDAMKRGGGVTHRSFHSPDPRQITWATISISRQEKGKRLTQIALHEVGHALGLEHAGPSDDDAMNERVYTDKISSADRRTLELIYQNRPKVD
jgi:predicted Zn-dependent protease